MPVWPEILIYACANYVNLRTTATKTMKDTTSTELLANGGLAQARPNYGTFVIRAPPYTRLIYSEAARKNLAMGMRHCHVVFATVL